MKITKILLIFSIIILMILTIFVNPVMGATGDITITDWESFNLGVISGSNGYMAWQMRDDDATTDSVVTTGALSGHCMKVKQTAGATKYARLFVNFTDDYSYIHNINIWIEGTTGGYKIVLYNNSGIVAYIIHNSGAPGTWQYDPVDAGLTTFASSLDSEDGWLNITHVSDNELNYTWYENGGHTTEYKVGASYVTSDWSNITRILITTVNNGALDFLVDDIIINTVSTGSGGYGSLENYTPICSGGLGLYTQLGYSETTPYYWFWSTTSQYPIRYIEHEFPYIWSGTIYGVDLPVSIDQLNYVSNDTNDYWLSINGIPSFGHPDYILPTTDGEYVLRWISSTGITLSHEKPLFEFYCDEHTIGFSKDWYWYGVGTSYNAIGDSLGHNNNGWYGDGNFNGYNIDGGDISMCYYVTTDTTQQGETGLTPTELVNYTGLYGYTFIEFYQNTVNCFHGIGSNPYIMYYLNDTYLEVDSPFYRYQIMQVGSNAPIYDGLISMTGTHKDAKMRIMDYEFTQKGQYYIVLYNTTDYGTVFGSEIYYSQVITVCDVGLGDPVEDMDTGEITIIDFSSIPVFFKVIIALLIIVILTICPYFFAVLIGRGTNNHIEIPSLVYIAFFFVGIVASVMLGFLDSWVFFIIFFGLILTLAILWIRGQSSGGE